MICMVNVKVHVTTSLTWWQCAARWDHFTSMSCYEHIPQSPGYSPGHMRLRAWHAVQKAQWQQFLVMLNHLHRAMPHFTFTSDSLAFIFAYFPSCGTPGQTFHCKPLSGLRFWRS